jgi:hypothetical protein
MHRFQSALAAMQRICGKFFCHVAFGVLPRYCMSAFAAFVADQLGYDRAARLARCDNGGDDDFLPVLVSLTKGQQNQSLMVNALLSVVVYFV